MLDNLEHRAVLLDVVRTGVGDREEELVLVDPCRLDEHDPAALELPRDRAGGAEVAAVLREQVPHVGGGAVAVVGQRLDEHGDALGAVTLVDDGLEHRPVGALAGSLRDRAVDVVLRHRVRARLLDRVRERHVGGRIGAALLGCDENRS